MYMSIAQNEKPSTLKLQTFLPKEKFSENEWRKIIHMFFNEMRDHGVEVNEDHVTLL